MIQIQNVSKKFQKQVIFDDFSYDFIENKFYLIYGYSGCGKTTLVNMIMNIEPYDVGSICIDGKENNQYTQDELLSKIGYMTQDSYFVDYLTTDEHLKMTIGTYKKAMEYMKKFNLEHTLNKLPAQLSGGEKQRIAIIKAIAAGKKILILDEPTSSLDKENKLKVFSFLKQISQEAMILCISHDEEAKRYCDELLDFNAKNNFKISKKKVEKENNEIMKTKLISLYLYVKKRERTEKDKTSKKILVTIFVAFLLLLSFCIQPENKLVEALGNQYHINYLQVEIPLNDFEESYKMLENNEHITDIVYNYNKGGDYYKSQLDGNIEKGQNGIIKSLVYETLPLSDSFYYHDSLVVGKYFTKSNQIILGYNLALSLYNDVELAVDEKVELQTGLGKEIFTVVGVFKYFENEELEYFKNGMDVQNINNIGFFNEAYTSTYLEDEILSVSEKHNNHHSFTIYFDQFSSLLEFQKKYNKVDYYDNNDIFVHTIESNNISQINDMKMVQLINYPLSVIAILISLLFYVQTTYIKLEKNIKEFAIYEYYGYSWKNIRNTYLRYFTVELLKLILFSIIVAFVVGFSLQIANQKFTLYPYVLFQLDKSLLFLPVIVFLIATMFNTIMLNRFKYTRWYDAVKERRDLL